MPSKEELLARAESLGVSVSESMTKAEIEDAIASGAGGVAPIEGSLSEAEYMEAPDGHRVKDDGEEAT